MSDAFTSDTYEALCKEAEDYLSRGLAEQARELLLKAISLIGTRPKARSLLADCCMSLGLWSEARAQLETLTTLEVGNPSHHFRLGQVMEEMGEYAMARDNYSVVLEHEPDNHAAAVALNRLKDRPDSVEPEEGAEEEAGEPEEAVRRSGDVQVYPDDESEEGVFASASEDEVEKLLKDIGVAPSEAEGEEGTDVAELLSSMGIDLGDSSKKKQQQQTKDISEILGGEGARQAEAGEEEAAGAEAPGEEEPQQAEETQEEPSLDAIFGGPPKEPEEPQAAPEGEEEEEGETSLEAIFGGAEEEEPEEEEPSEEEAGPSLAAIFGGAAAPEQEEAEGEKAPEEAEAEAEEPQAEAVEEEQAEEEPAAEEEAEPAEEEAGPSLAAIFGGAAAPEQEEAEGEKAPEEEEPEEEPEAEHAAEEEPEEEPEAEHAGEEEPEAEPAGEEEPEAEPAEEKAGPSLAAIFGGAGTEAEEEEPEEAPEEGGEAEEKKSGPPLSAIFGGGPEKKEKAEEEPVGEEAPAEELPEEAEEKAEEPPEEEEGPQPEEEPAEEEAPAAPKAGIVCHRPAPESVAVVYLEDVEVIVKPGFLAAADGSLEASEEDGVTLLRGSGRAWIGDGAAVPVSLSVSDGLRVRPGRLALRQSSVELEEADGNGLSGVGGEGSLALLAGGRFRWLSCTGGDGCLRISGESIVAVEGDVELEPAENTGEGFLLASGEGRVLISC